MENSSLQQNSKNGSNAVQQLRKTRLGKGLPFMINTAEFGENGCYLEYPDGRITKVAVSKSGIEFQILQTLSANDANELRASFSLV